MPGVADGLIDDVPNVVVHIHVGVCRQHFNKLPKAWEIWQYIWKLNLGDFVHVHFFSSNSRYQQKCVLLSDLMISQPFISPWILAFCFNLVHFETALSLELTIHLLQSDGVVDDQNCCQCNPSSTEKTYNIGNVVDESVVDAAVGDEMVNNIGPNIQS